MARSATGSGRGGKATATPAEQPQTEAEAAAAEPSRHDIASAAPEVDPAVNTEAPAAEAAATPEVPPFEASPLEAPLSAPPVDLPPEPATGTLHRAEPAVLPAERRGPGLLPLALVSLVSAALGAGAAIWYLGQQPAGPDFAALEARIAGLETRPATDPAAIEAAIESRLAARIAALEQEPAGLAALQSGLDALEASLTGRIAAVEGALGTVESLDDWRASLDTELDSRIGVAVDSAASSTLAQLEQQQAEARADLEARANTLAEASAVAERSNASSAALTAVVLAAQQGQSAAQPLDLLENELGFPRVDGAEVLRAGLPQLAQLQAEFAPAARSALAAAPEEAAESFGGQVLGFLRRQTNARSLAPREGGDTDAVLSRAEAALRAGNLETALSELDQLPEAPAAAMAAWRARAAGRQAGLSALDDLQAHAAAAARAQD